MDVHLFELFQAGFAGGSHSLLAVDNVTHGLDELELSESILAVDLAENLEVLGEAIQTVIRAEVAAGRSTISNPYELLKELTRGKRISVDDLQVFINQLEIGQDAKDHLLLLTPHTYIGLAEQIAGRVQR